MRFLCKIIWCPCYSEMLSALAEYDELNRDFNCSCDLEHNVHVLKCQGYPFVHNLNTHLECLCKELSSFEICRSCMEKRLVLNYTAKKYCFKKLPSFIENNMVCFEQFL